MSHRGLSGTYRRSNRMPRPSTPPTANPSRQPTLIGRTFGSRNKSDAPEPAAAPSQKLPLTIRSTRPRKLAGISSSMAELIAAYSPPMPNPVIARKRAKLQKLHDVAVSNTKHSRDEKNNDLMGRRSERKWRMLASQK